MNLTYMVMRLQSRILAGLKAADKGPFDKAFSAAMNEQPNLSRAIPVFAIWLLTDEENGAIKPARSKGEVKAINFVASLYQRHLDGDKPADDEWLDAVRASENISFPAYCAANHSLAYAAAYLSHFYSDSQIGFEIQGKKLIDFLKQ